jgi:cytochrome c oxidase subunit 2
MTDDTAITHDTAMTDDEAMTPALATEPSGRHAKVRTRRRKIVTVVSLGSAFALILSGCVGNPTQSTLKAHGSVARQLNSLFIPVFWIAVAVFALVAGLVLYAVIRFRARSDDEAPVQIHGNTKLELMWTIAPAVLLAAIAIPTVKMVFDTNSFPSNAMQITTTGHRWWWQFGYDGTNVQTANELHLPVKQKVVLQLTSVDVIHNFWVPELAGKIYAIPGRHNRLLIEADQPGTYFGQCAEYCGTSHANMRIRVVVQTESDFQAWEAGQEQGPATPDPSNAAATAGLALFSARGCTGCHAINGISDGVVGPNLTHFASRSVFAGSIFANNDNNLRAWLQNPPGQKPGSVMPNLNLSQDDINKLVAYLDTLK